MPSDYGSADGGQQGVYNNNSGNWRFADVGFAGTAAVPEPSTLTLMSIVAILIAAVRVRKSSITRN